ncbi:hypothetical protein [Bacillus sp. NEB1478]|uniref:hypothetical protein n=1 Tax=Bacillus sp. NEB1478 TaxID=3073816 RepID=UPI00287391A7|nr:hypothetical protein [Bacillus sp. NEB1478]WNB93543.1 hypothetical protein RGB74_07720 [Bacillus sp. NEB1478]
MKWKISIFMLIIILVIGIIYQPFIKKEARESITFFPLDSTFTFADTSTTLTFKKGTPANYVLDWIAESKSSEKVYLRQDISMVFQNGVFNNKMTEWKTTANEIHVEKELEGKSPGLWEAVSYHQGEIHINEEKYRSMQEMTNDYIYTILPNGTYTGFKNPKNAKERQSKNQLDQQTNQFLQRSLNESTNHFQIDKNKYEIISLESLTNYNKKPLTGFSPAKSQEIIGKLWEGLYKNYFVNITTKSGQKVSPIGSSMPYILISKDKTHLFVLFQTAAKENIQLIQYIS